MAIQVGDAAPDFALPASNGETVRLGDFRGQPVVLYFYPKDETPLCTREAQGFRDAHDDLSGLGAVVIGVSRDSVDSHRAFAEHHGLPFLLASDADGALRERYGVPKTLGLLDGRVTFEIDGEGVVRHRLSAAFSARKHVEQALAAVRDLPARSTGEPA